MIFLFRLIATLPRLILSTIMPSYIQKKTSRAIARNIPSLMHLVSRINFIKIFLSISIICFICGTFFWLDENLLFKFLKIIHRERYLTKTLKTNLYSAPFACSTIFAWACVYIRRQKTFHYMSQSIEALCHFLLNCPYTAETEKISYCLINKGKIQSSLILLQEVAIKDRVKNGKNSKLSKLATTLLSNFEYIEESGRPSFIIPSFVNDKSITSNPDTLMTKKVEIRQLCDLIINYCTYL